MVETHKGAGSAHILCHIVDSFFPALTAGKFAYITTRVIEKRKQKLKKRRNILFVVFVKISLFSLVCFSCISSSLLTFVFVWLLFDTVNRLSSSVNSMELLFMCIHGNTVSYDTGHLKVTLCAVHIRRH